MWRPGFPYREEDAGRIHGWHRAACIYSWHHRGTQKQPGLVMGLDRGGSCRGRAFRVMPENWEAVQAYLDEREMVTAVYQRRFVRVALDDGRVVTALTYVVNRAHDQYAGRLRASQAARLLVRGRGVSGACYDYFRATRESLLSLGIRDATIDAAIDAAEGLLLRGC